MDELRANVENRIRTAFAGVQLGTGVSLREAQSFDNYGRGYKEFLASPPSEVRDDWSRVPQSEIESDYIAHLDGEGLRYYLPALMLNLLDRYDAGWSMWMIGTIMAIAPAKEDLKTDIWLMYSHLSDAQKSAVAVYLDALPRLVQLRRDDALSVTNALRDYWAQFLPEDTVR